MVGRAGDERTAIRNRIDWLKRAVAVGTAGAFVVVWGLAAEHLVGVTSHSAGATSTQPTTQQQGVGDESESQFFGGNSGSPFASGSGGNGPVLSSGGS